MRSLALLLIVGSAVAVAAPVPCNLARVIDGDTIVCRIDGAEVRVRALGYDTPETISRCTREAVMAARATDTLATLLASGELVTIDPVGLDRYGRTLARVLVDGQDVSGLMLASGYARPYDGGRRAGWCSDAP